MFAIVETAGKQYRVETGATITVDRIGAEVGASVVLDRVLMVSSDNVKVGAPVVEGASVHAEVVDHVQGDKVMTFKYTPRGRSRRRVGFRHAHTTLRITDIQG
jgi:large subunit ribosomal protein L21